MPSKVHVGNLPDNCQPDTLRDLFSGYGIINELDIIKNFAFVHFDRESDASQAVKDLDHTKLLGKVITVQISKHQKSGDRDRNRGDRDRNRRDDRKPPPRRGHPNMGNGPPPGGPLPGIGLGGILGAGPGASLGPGALGGAPLGGLGILNAVNNLVAEQQRSVNESERLERDRRERERERERDHPDPDVRVRREVVNTRDVPNASRLGLTSGYVIYERYYVDPSHPLLKGLPLPDLPRMTDTFVSRDTAYRPAPAEPRRDDYDDYRDRSPMQDPQDYERDQERRLSQLRDLDYRGGEYFDRR